MRRLTTMPPGWRQLKGHKSGSLGGHQGASSTAQLGPCLARILQDSPKRSKFSYSAHWQNELRHRGNAILEPVRSIVWEAHRTKRSMYATQDEYRSVGRSGRLLGVRIDGRQRDVEPDAMGSVHPTTGGMSVTPNDLWAVQAHRRPRRLGRGSTGHDADRLFSILSDEVSEQRLSVRPNPRWSGHAFVEPSEIEALDVHEARLAATRTRWINAEP